MSLISGIFLKWLQSLSNLSLNTLTWYIFVMTQKIVRIRKTSCTVVFYSMVSWTFYTVKVEIRIYDVDLVIPCKSVETKIDRASFDRRWQRGFVLKRMKILYYKIQSVCVFVWLSVCPFGIGSQTMRTTVMNLLQVTQWV